MRARAGFALLALAALPAWAQAPATLDELLEQTRSARAAEARENEARVERFAADLARQQALLAEARAERDREARLADQASARFDANERLIAELQAQLDAKTGHLGEMFGVVRQVAGDVQAVALNSLVSVEHPERVAALAELAASRGLPSIEALESLWLEMLREISESGKVSRFTAPVVGPDGVERPQTVVRVGSFTAVSGARYLSQAPGELRLIELPAQPGGIHPRNAQRLFDAASGYVSATIDPTRGALLALLVQAPKLADQIRAGGLVGYVILGLGLFGLLLAVERLIALLRAERAVARQRQQLEHARPDNPLGRVLGVYHRDPHVDHETLDLRLDEAVMREIPGLEARLPWLKLLAAIAPLLGLLGTVTGMILTFQQITLFGTGDPKLMAGGISQALVTTVLGLLVAIPMVLLHSWLNGKSKALIQILEEEAAGLIAESAERRRAA